MKTFVDKVKRLGWSLEYEDVDYQKYSLSKGDDVQNIEIEFSDYDMLKISSSFDIPYYIEDFAEFERMLQSYIKAEVDEKSYIEHEGKFGERIKYCECYTVFTEDGSKENWNEVEAEYIDEMLDNFISRFNSVESALPDIYAKLLQWQEINYIDPESAIRIPIGRIQAAYRSLTDALDQYIHDNLQEEIFNTEESISHFCSWIGDIALYNLPYRNLLREHGVDALIKKICEDEPRLPEERVKNNIQEMWKKCGEKLKDYDIRFMGLREKVCILGKTFEGIADFMDDDEVHVACYMEPYPCFDEFDALNEDRWYKAWAFSKEPIGERTCGKLSDLVRLSLMWDFNKLTPNMLPIVFDNGDSPVAYMITSRI